MPYIDPKSRYGLNRPGGMDPATVGELTYVLTQVVLDYLDVAPSFSDLAEALAALEATKLELYRRSVAPYEDAKVAVNGDLPYPHNPSHSARAARGEPSPFRVDL